MKLTMSNETARTSAFQEILVPRFSDIRFHVLVLLVAFVAYAVTSPAYSRTIAQVAIVLGTCLILDTALTLWLRGRVILPMSAFVTSMGTVLLCDSPDLWAYFFVAAISILSKHIIRINGIHIFNPNNFGVVLGLLFFSHSITVDASRWGGHFWLTCVIFVLGASLIYRANRLYLAFAFFLTFMVLAFARYLIGGFTYAFYVSPLLGPAFQLFVFYMITDPRTSPSKPRDQILFGFCVGAIDALFRMYQEKYAPFYALFITCGLFSASARLVQQRLQSYPWKVRSVKV